MKSNIAISLVVIVLLLISGCTTNNSSNPITVVPTQPIETVPSSIVTVPVTTIPVIINDSQTKSIPVITETTASIAMYTTNALGTANDPYVYNFKVNQNVLQISDCVMKQLFPKIANNPNYGLNHDTPYFVGLSATKVNSDLQDYNTGKNAGQSESITSTVDCKNVPTTESSTWHFDEVTSKFNPRNVRPSEYMIILSVHSKGKVVSQIVINQTLTQDEPVSIDTLIPYKGTDTIDTVSMNFNRLTNT